MCGICGIVPDRLDIEIARSAVYRMSERMFSRGPDAGSVVRAENVVLGHRRLAILDLDARAN